MLLGRKREERIVVADGIRRRGEALIVVADGIRRRGEALIVVSFGFVLVFRSHFYFFSSYLFNLKFN